MRTRFITQAAVIAALYAALTLLSLLLPSVGMLAIGPFQLRISEALTVLPFFTPAAVPGLTVGCLLSNLVGAAFGLGGGAADVIFGTLATLLAALCTARVRCMALAPLPPVVFNALILAGVTVMVVGGSYGFWLLWIALGQAASCFGLGLPLMLYLRAHPRLFGSGPSR